MCVLLHSRRTLKLGRMEIPRLLLDTLLYQNSVVDMIYAYEISVGKCERKRAIGRPRRKWSSGVEHVRVWIRYMSHDIYMQIFVCMVMKLWFPC